MEIKIKAYAYTIDIITEIRYFCKCNNAVFGKFRIIFTRANTLASLVKGEVLSPKKIRATTGGIATPPFPQLQ